MPEFPPIPDQLELLRRGLHDELPVGGLEDKLRTSVREGRPLRVKLGVDPTASRVHLGWAVVLRKLRQFQECGHTAVLILGTFTAQVGDPSGKSQTRKRLTSAQVEEYAEQCIGVLEQILLPERLEIHPNHEWLAPMDMAEVLELTTHTTVAQMLERDDFAKRFAAHKPISLIEFLYPLLQARDSVAVDADVELGGTDQTFNNLMGRHLQQALGRDPQAVCTVPLLVGTDGTEKMSQSLGNGIFIDDPPAEMFGRLMSIPDSLIVDYARLAAWWPTDTVEALSAGLRDGTEHPNEAKRRMACDVVDLYHGAGAGAGAEGAFDRQFRERRVPEDVPDFEIPARLPGGEMPGGEVGLVELVSAAFGVSKGEARRLLDQGGIRLDGDRVPAGDAHYGAVSLDGRVLQAGKRRFVRIRAVL
ncbi:MAG: tyrosine--tRNA ligase [Acidimicrobiia bacterium]|nr:tyrosine--tRNA ligase [Acidimicrobiia bacterium]